MAALSGYLALGTSSAGSFVERATSGYARQAISLVSGRNGESANAVAIKFPVAAGQLPYSAAAIYSASSGGSPLFWWEERSPDGFFDTDSKWTIPPGGVSVRFPAATAGDGGPLYADQVYHWRPDGLSGSSSSGAVGLTNFRPDNLKKWRKAKANVRAGLANGKIAFVGDSTTRGIFSAAGAAAYLNGYPARVCDIINGMGLKATRNGTFGTGNTTTPSNDSRVVYSGGASSGGGNATLGGGLMQINAAGQTISFTPQESVDTFDVYYVKISSGGTFTVNIDGGATLATITTNPGTSIQKQTFTTTLGAHTINCVWASGVANFIAWIDAYDSTKKQILCWNMGAGSAKSADICDVSAAYAEGNSYSVAAPDLTVIDIGINDWNTGVSLATYQTNLQAAITQAKAVGDVILKTPVPSAISAVPLATQQQYVDVMTTLAAANDLPLIDGWRLIGSYEDANALGMYADTLHPNGLGYAVVAELVAKALMI